MLGPVWTNGKFLEEFIFFIDLILKMEYFDGLFGDRSGRFLSSAAYIF